MTFWHQDVPAPRHTQPQDVLDIKTVASSCPASRISTPDFTSREGAVCPTF